MAAEKGSGFILKIGNGATSETFATVGGMRTKSLTINNEAADITDDDSAGKRELLAAAGIQAMTLSGSGVFKDSAAETTVRTQAQNRTIVNWKITFADGDTYTGAFYITSLEYTGEYNGARMYSITLESSGAVTYA